MTRTKNKSKFIFIAFWFVLGSVSANAEWQPLGPSGGKFEYFVFSSASTKTIFAVGSNPDYRYIYRSKDLSVTWQRLSVRGILRINRQNQIVVTGGQETYVSNDLGDTWQTYVCSDCGGFDDMEVSSRQPSTLYAVKTDWTSNADRLEQSVFKSSDLGRTWSKLSAVGYFDSENLPELEIDPVTDTLYVQLPNGKVMKSTDQGITWSSASQGLSLRIGDWALEIDDKRPSTLFSIGPTGLFRTTNSGSSWQKLNLNCSDCKPNSLTVDPVDSNIIYVAGAGSKQALRSSDGGKTWMTMNAPALGLPYQTIAASPWSPQLLLAAVSTRGILKSTDRDVTWKAANPGIRELSVRVEANAKRTGSLIAYGDIVLFSKDFGKSWQYKPELNTGAEQAKIDIADPNFQVISGSQLKVTIDGGLHWLSRTCCGGDIELGRGRIIFQSPQRIVRSADLGASWQQIGPPLAGADEFVVSFAVDPKNNNIIYASVHSADPDYPNSGRILKTTDGGRQWKKLNVPAGGAYTNQIVIHPQNSNVIYAATLVGTLKSTNGGAAWTNVATGFHGGDITLDPKNQRRAFVVITGFIWETKDGGRNWATHSTAGLPNNTSREVKKLIVSPWNSNILYAGTSNGIYAFKE